MFITIQKMILPFKKNMMVPVRAPVFGRHQFFGTSEHCRKAHGSLLSGWMNFNYTAYWWFPTSSNILILPPQFWQIRFESYWLLCSKCRILVLLRYMMMMYMYYQFLKHADLLESKSIVCCLMIIICIYCLHLMIMMYVLMNEIIMLLIYYMLSTSI